MLIRVEHLDGAWRHSWSGSFSELVRIPSERSVVARQIERKGAESDGQCLSLATDIRERKSEKCAHRTVQCIVPRVFFSGKQGNCFLRLS